MTPVRLDNLTAVAVTDCSSSCASIQRQAGGCSAQDLLLGIWPLFLLVTLLLSLRKAKLFGWVGRHGEDGLPVRPYKHDEKEVEEDQVDNLLSYTGDGDNTKLHHISVIRPADD